MSIGELLNELENITLEMEENYSFIEEEYGYEAPTFEVEIRKIIEELREELK